jgi:alpha-tubulin suppressor-like RCC1 family protein
VLFGAIDDARSIAAGGDQTCVIRSDNALWCWGADGDGVTPVQHALAQVLSDVVQVSVGDAHACAVRADHTVWCWGGNSEEQADPSWGSYLAEPRQVAADAVRVVAGYDRSCAFHADGKVSCWGGGSSGHYPVASAPEFEGAVDLGLSYHECAANAEGELSCGGVNRWGALGTGDGRGHAELVTLLDLTDVSRVSVAKLTSCALTSAGTLWCWGSNARGQVGHGGLTEEVWEPARVRFEPFGPNVRP